jgi:hypothetical protein
MFNRNKNKEPQSAPRNDAERKLPASAEALERLNELCDKIAGLDALDREYTRSYSLSDAAGWTRIARQYSNASHIVEMQPATEGWRIRNYVRYSDDGGKVEPRRVDVVEFVCEPGAPGERKIMDALPNGFPSETPLSREGLSPMTGGACEGYTSSLLDVLRAAGVHEERTIAIAAAGATTRGRTER